MESLRLSGGGAVKKSELLSSIALCMPRTDTDPEGLTAVNTGPDPWKSCTCKAGISGITPYLYKGGVSASKINPFADQSNFQRKWAQEVRWRLTTSNLASGSRSLPFSDSSKHTTPECKSDIC